MLSKNCGLLAFMAVFGLVLEIYALKNGWKP